MHFNFCFCFFTCYVIPVGITSSAIGLRICAITAGIKKCKSIIKKKNMLKVLLGKTMIISIEVLISKALINSDISHEEFVLINNVLREHEMKKTIKN